MSHGLGQRYENRGRGERRGSRGWRAKAPAVLGGLALGLLLALAGCGYEEGDWRVTGAEVLEASEERAVVAVRLGRTVVIGTREVPGEVEYVCTFNFGDCDVEERQGPSSYESVHGVREQFGLVLELDLRRAEAELIEVLEPRPGEVEDCAPLAREEARASCAAGQPLALVLSADEDGVELLRCSSEPDLERRRPLPAPQFVLEGESLRALYAATLAW